MIKSIQTPCITLLLIVLSFAPVYGYFSSSNFTIHVNNMNEENSKKFMDNKNVLVDAFNDLKLPSSLSPIIVNITYSESGSTIEIECAYDSTILKAPSDYYYHQRDFNLMGRGISVLFCDYIFSAISQYKFKVASKGWLIDTEIMKFDNSIKLKKRNGDYVIFYSQNQRDSRGYYPHIFYDNVDVKFGKFSFEIESTNSLTLQNNKFFYVGNLIGMDGKKTGSYYLCKFFGVSTE